jgi:hypothetical protein
MLPIEKVLAELPGARQSPKGWTARCPAHDDRDPSLSISIGDDSKVLMKCFAGCSVEAIVAALGLSMGDLFPSTTFTGLARNGPRRKASALSYSTVNAVLAELVRRHGPYSAYWTYHAIDGEAVGLVVRWDKPSGKDYRPAARYGDGWRIEAMPTPRPLYRLPELLAASLVVVTEGEKAADAARTLGFTATTSAGGSQAARQTDWRPMAGKEVWIFPDNDAPGPKYADTAAGILARLAPAPVIRIVELPGLPHKGDIVEWIEGHGDAAEPADMRAEIEALARAVQPWNGQAGAGKRLRYVPELVCLADVEPQAVPWLWPGRIPLGRISLLVGRPGAGKSFLTSDLAARISTAAPWPVDCYSAAPLGDTLFICAEDDPADTIVPRLVAAGADRTRIHLLKAAKLIEDDGKESTVAFDLQNVGLIRDALVRLPACKLVVVDPVGSYLGGRVDAHRDNEVRAVLAPLAQLAAERGVAVLLVCHTRKALANYADDSTLGSRAFVGLARSVMHLMADEQDRNRKLLLPGKCNLAHSAPGLAFRIGGNPTHLDWEPEPLEGFHADDAIGPSDRNESARGPAPAAREAAVKWLSDVLAASPLPVAEIEAQAKAAGLSKATVRRAREEMGIIPRKRTFSGGWEWGLPEPQEVHPIAKGAPAVPRCPRGEKPAHLRENRGESSGNSPPSREDVQVSDNLRTFDNGSCDPGSRGPYAEGF